MTEEERLQEEIAKRLKGAGKETLRTILLFTLHLTKNQSS